MNIDGVRFRVTAIIAVAGFGLLVNISDVSGQTKRRKKVRPTASRTVPAISGAEPQIISRAGDFPDTESSILVSNTDQKTDEIGTDVDSSGKTIEDLKSRVKILESVKSGDRDDKQKRLLLNLDILTRAEQRAETLRKQLFEMIEKESSIRTKLDLIENDIRPETIDRSVAFAGTLRPEELRNMRKKNLEIERTNLQSLLSEIQRTKSGLEQNVQRADIMVEKLRAKLEKEIDDALIDEPAKP